MISTGYALRADSSDMEHLDLRQGNSTCVRFDVNIAQSGTKIVDQWNKFGSKSKRLLDYSVLLPKIWRGRGAKSPECA